MINYCDVYTRVSTVAGIRLGTVTLATRDFLHIRLWNQLLGGVVEATTLGSFCLSVYQDSAAFISFLNHSSEPIDAEFSQFLSEEIAREQESHKDHQEVKTVEGWTPEFKGTDVVLSKSHKNEKISVKFNIVDSVDVADDSLESEETKDVKMLSKPPFVVEIHKAGGKILTLECQFSGMDEELDTPEADQQEDVYGDKFQILEIALHDSEISSTSYSAQTSTMDASMYEMLMDMLDDRGIDDKFMDQLLNFCTDYEHAQYIKFLGDLKSFVDTK
ncbi:hypothetical protein FSP39_015148 [Pinctada imbricata]|uniref:Complement component 1 Q subcomponent-binding protein, mitochondrial n=1 Tax=Pinctada imbricata TaxID=66713 RepID=A0AA89BJF4_PINIB|nr:hypothetical protein FSP39_015148 [Pinctada imbricata]